MQVIDQDLAKVPSDGGQQQQVSDKGKDILMEQMADGSLIKTLATFRQVSLNVAKYKQKEIRILGQIFRVLKKICTVS